jgi:hypothetical protein
MSNVAFVKEIVVDGTRIVHILPTSMAFELQIKVSMGASLDATQTIFRSKISMNLLKSNQPRTMTKLLQFL